MIESNNEVSKDLEKALQTLEQAKQRAANEKKKQSLIGSIKRALPNIQKCERLQNLLEQGEKITPKQWKAEIQSLQNEYDSISREKSKTATELAYAEVISYNRKNIVRELQNESRQHNRQQSRTKGRAEELR